MRLLVLIVMCFVFGAEKPVQKASADTTNVVVLDVRTPDEFSEGHAKGAINIDVSAADFDKKMKALNKSKKYFVHCQAGGRSAVAVKKMKNFGFKNVEDLSSLDAAQEKFGKEPK